ncbi:MAG: ABC transporter permease subunit [Myxococcales bacterium]|nr:ABC transporter permease subunit [Myxococcales bacterium]
MVAKRELSAWARSPGSWVIAAAVLLIDGLLFNGFAVSGGAKLSTQVLQDFFYFAAGTTMIASVLLSMRLIAEERQAGSLALLLSSPAPEGAIVFGKFIAALTVLAALTLSTLYMPALIFLNGKVSVGHIAGGYLGLLLLGSASLAIGTLGSALGRSQLVAGVLSTVMITALLLCWILARISDSPIKEVLRSMALFNAHFKPFQLGQLRGSDVVFFVSLSWFALTAATVVLQRERWGR